MPKLELRLKIQETIIKLHQHRTILFSPIRQITIQSDLNSLKKIETNDEKIQNGLDQKAILLNKKQQLTEKLNELKNFKSQIENLKNEIQQLQIIKS